ncbi:uncharacterized protein LOC127618313 [Xyrauchen texanus]|uniref:uncharacterized protein LOC127618313 n=1 Tax=Xyrauchen texanus TaxID=154827 RepID=UPI0022422BD7|nr:uncharacterized protein LOC127618313 [Xyrauchen texanus]
MVSSGKAPSHKLSGNDSGRVRARALPPDHSGSPRPGPLGQQVCGILSKPSGRCQIQEPLPSDETHTELVPAPPALAEGDARARPPERRPRQTVQRQYSPREWSLHAQTVQTLWRIFGRAEIDLFASEENSHCPIFFSKSEDALAQDWPNRPLYAFPPVSLLPQVMQRIRETRHSVLLIAPRWENQTWFPELTQLSLTAPWPIPVRADLLTQARGTI